MPGIGLRETKKIATAPAPPRWTETGECTSTRRSNTTLVVTYLFVIEVMLLLSLPILVVGSPSTMVANNDGSKKQSWKVSAMTSVNLDDSVIKCDGIIVNGVVYWKMTNQMYGIHAYSRLCLLDVYGCGVRSLQKPISFEVCNSRKGVEDCVVMSNSSDDVTMKMTDAYHVKDQKVKEFSNQICQFCID